MAAVTEVSASSKPGWKVGSLGVRAANDAMFPPAELPDTNSTAGSAPYSGPWARAQAITFLRSIRWSGCCAAGRRRWFALTHTQPWLASRWSSGRAWRFFLPWW
jgi:hypothetical protein